MKSKQLDFTIFVKLYCPGWGEKSDVLMDEIAPHGGNLHHLEGRPGLIPRFPPGMGVGGFPLTTA